MIKPHETEKTQKFDLDAQARYEQAIDDKISVHDFDTSSDLHVDDPPGLTLADRNAVLSKYAASYKLDDDTTAPGWVVVKQTYGVTFRRPLTRG